MYRLSHRSFEVRHVICESRIIKRIFDIFAELRQIMWESCIIYKLREGFSEMPLKKCES